MKAIPTIALFLFTGAMSLSCGQQANDVPDEAETAQKAMEAKMVAANEALFVAWNTGDAAIVEEHLTAEFTRTQNGEPSSRNREEYITLMKTFRTAIPDLTFTHELPAISDNKSLTKWTAKGTNTGFFGEQPATGKSSVTHGLTILTFNDDGKVILEEAYFDPLSYLLAWGYTLVPPATE